MHFEEGSGRIGKIQPVVDPERDQIVFAGPREWFSDTLLRNMEQVCPELRPVRYACVDDYLAALEAGAPGEAGAGTRLLIVYSALFGGDSARYSRFAERFRKRDPGHEPPGLALAYSDPAEARALLPVLDADIDLRGLLPMNLAIDIWLSVVRLLASGGKYFPHDLLLDSRRAAGKGAGVDAGKVAGEGAPPAVAAPPGPDAIVAPEGIAPAPGDVPAAPVAPVAPVAQTPPETALAPAAEAAAPGLSSPLTLRETEVAHLLAKGLQNKQIAAALDVSEHTVKLHIHHIITKLQVRNRTEAAMKFLALRGS